MPASRLLRLAVALLLAATFSGCASSNVRIASAHTPPAVSLALSGRPSSALQAIVETVIIYDGPGSWKRRAFWDEYVVTVKNTGPTPASILGATLVDAQNQWIQSGSDWKDLERQSADWWKRNATANNLALGAGMTVLAGTVGASAIAMFAAAIVGSGPVLGIAAGAALVSLGTAHLVTTQIDDAEQFIASEFDRRRIRYPHAVAAKSATSGSFFFRITPSPQQLFVHLDVAGRKQVAVVDLPALNGLHRKRAAAAAGP